MALKQTDNLKYYGLNVVPSFTSREDEIDETAWHVEFRLFPQITGENLDKLIRYIYKLCQIYAEAARRAKDTPAARRSRARSW